MPDLASAIRNASDWLRVNDSIPYGHGEQEGAHVAILRTLLTAAREAEAEKWSATCDVCLGDPLPGTRECICGGTGRLGDTVTALREISVAAIRRAEKAEGDLDSERRWAKEYHDKWQKAEVALACRPVTCPPSELDVRWQIFVASHEAERRARQKAEAALAEERDSHDKTADMMTAAVDELELCADAMHKANDHIDDLRADLAEVTVLLRESNAVCACGCPPDMHESYGEDGECCGHDGHECVRTSLVVYYMLRDLRADRDALLAEIQKWREGRAYLGVPMTYVDQRLVDETRTFIGNKRAAGVKHG